MSNFNSTKFIAFVLWAYKDISKLVAVLESICRIEVSSRTGCDISKILAEGESAGFYYRYVFWDSNVCYS